MIKVCYFTTKPSTDIRVFEKECKSLSGAGYDVYLVSPNAVTETIGGVKIVGFSYKLKSSFFRFLYLPFLLFRTASSINADIYHFNDPASLVYGLIFKLRGKKVIFDSFEDHPTLLLEHKKIPKILLSIIIKLYSFYEFQLVKKFDAVICCYHWTFERLSKACGNTVLVFNFPVLRDTVRENINIENTSTFKICYAGLISSMWNIDKIIDSLSYFNNVRFILAGHGGEDLIPLFRNSQNWNNVNFLGKIKYERVLNEVYSSSSIGIALLDYIPMCKGKYGNLSNNKLFEYLMAGLPVICTDFYLWKQVVEENNCGICINPNDVNALVNAIETIKNNKELADKMSRNGRHIVETKYNWSFEAIKLLKVYNQIV